jgi:hypothetical protein
MQGFHPLLDGHPSFLPQETETAHPRTPIPIFYIHSLRHPYCKKPLCPCQRQRREAASLMGYVADSQLLLADAALLIDERREATMSSATGTPQTTRIHVDLVPGIPEECQLYGHDWQITEHRDVQECTLCHIRGYCPGCTPLAPANAQPFTCSEHAGQTGRGDRA